jgi:hypothetical protein
MPPGSKGKPAANAGDDDDDELAALQGAEEEYWTIVCPGAHSTLILEPGEIDLDAELAGMSMNTVAGLCERWGANRERLRLQKQADAASAAAAMTADATNSAGGREGAVKAAAMPAVAMDEVELPLVNGVPRKHVQTLLNAIAERHVLFTVPVDASDAERLRWIAAVFDGARAKSTYFLSETLAVCYAVGELHGARVVDLGHSGVRVSYVAHGQTQRYMSKRSLGGANFAAAATAAAAHSAGPRNGGGFIEHGARDSDDDGAATAAAASSTAVDAAARQRYINALFPRQVSGHGLPFLLSKLPAKAARSPVIVVGGGVGLAGPALPHLCRSALVPVDVPSARGGDRAGAAAGHHPRPTSKGNESDDEESSSGEEEEASSSDDDPTAKLTTKVLISPSDEEARRIVAYGASLFGVAGVERLAVLRAQYDAAGPRLALSRFPK